VPRDIAALYSVSGEVEAVRRRKRSNARKRERFSISPERKSFRRVHQAQVVPVKSISPGDKGFVGT
jgi:hypothetical protein